MEQGSHLCICSSVPAMEILSSKSSLNLPGTHKLGHWASPVPKSRRANRLRSSCFAADLSSRVASLAAPCSSISKPREYVNWFRQAWPYIQGHRMSTFVIVLPGETVANRERLQSILQDISLLHGLGIRLVIVPGTHVQIDNLLREKGKLPKYLGAYRITDADALDASMEAAGKVRVEIEAKLSRGPSIPVLRRHGENERWHEPGLSIANGNFLSAKKRGVVNGVDFGSTGEVKKIDVARIKERLDNNCIVLLSNLGFSSSGEVLNCNTYEVATACAVALQADKLLCLLDGPVCDEKNFEIRFMTLQQADQLIRNRAKQSYIAADYLKAVAGPSYVKSLGLLDSLCITGDHRVSFLRAQPDGFTSGSPDGFISGSLVEESELEKQNERGFPIGGMERKSRTHGYLSELAAAVYVCRAGVRRVHLLDSTIEGALLLELYTRDGIGTMIASDMYEGIRPATPDDLQGIENLLVPLEEAGILVKRTRSKLLEDVKYYTVVEREGSIIACCALYPYWREKCAEVGAFAVASECRGLGQGDNLLDYLEKKAAAMGLTKLFLLTTRTADWFVRRGFSECSFVEIPAEKRATINLSRGSKYYSKQLQASSSSNQVALPTL